MRVPNKIRGNTCNAKIVGLVLWRNFDTVFNQDVDRCPLAYTTASHLTLVFGMYTFIHLLTGMLLRELRGLL